jgi:hypothetical protein
MSDSDFNGTKVIQRAQRRPGVRIDDARLADLAAKGWTARQCASALRVTPQAIRQRAAKLGLAVERDSSARNLSRNLHEKYGVTAETYEKCRANRAIKAFQRQKDTAKERGIEWLFTFAEWWAMWEASGKWELRGRLKRMGGWEMSRPGDVGPYSVDNVTIVSHRENMADVQARLAARRPPRKARERKPPHPRYVLMQEGNLDLAAAMRTKGVSFAAIGEALGVHPSSVGKALSKRNAEIRRTAID